MPEPPKILCSSSWISGKLLLQDERQVWINQHREVQHKRGRGPGPLYNQPPLQKDKLSRTFLQPSPSEIQPDRLSHMFEPASDISGEIRNRGLNLRHQDPESGCVYSGSGEETRAGYIYNTPSANGRIYRGSSVVPGAYGLIGSNNICRYYPEVSGVEHAYVDIEAEDRQGQLLFNEI